MGSVSSRSSTTAPVPASNTNNRTTSSSSSSSSTTSTATSSFVPRYVPVTNTPLPYDNGIRVICPSCNSVLIPPASMFLCPCGQLMTFRNTNLSSTVFTDNDDDTVSARTTTSTTQNPSSLSTSTTNPTTAHHPYRPVSSRLSSASSSTATRAQHIAINNLEDRLRFLIARMPSNDPHIIFIHALLNRLPRNSDGTLDLQAVDQIARQMDSSLRGASDSLISLLPTRKFVPSSLPSDATEELTTCLVCLSTFEENETLLTLPCLHVFHQDCIKPWLKNSKACPICKTNIDVDPVEIILQQQREEENRLLLKTNNGNTSNNGNTNSSSITNVNDGFTAVATTMSGSTVNNSSSSSSSLSSSSSNGRRSRTPNSTATSTDNSDSSNRRSFLRNWLG